MRTSIDIPDPMFAKAKKVAQGRGMTFRELVMEGLRLVTETEARRGRFRLREASFGEGGLVEGVSESDWERIRQLAYEGRGG